MLSNPTFDRFFPEVYLTYAKGRKRSWGLDNRLATKHISPEFGHIKLKEITAK